MAEQDEDQEQKEFPSLKPSATHTNYKSTETSSVTSSQSDDDGTEIISMNRKADRLSAKLTACEDDEAMERMVLKNSFDLSYVDDDDLSYDQDEALMDELNRSEGSTHRKNNHQNSRSSVKKEGYGKTMVQRVIAMFSLAVLGLMIIIVLLQIGTLIVGPPRQPIGKYKLVEIQEGTDFFNHYKFYNGDDSEGSNGYINYVSRAEATRLNIVNVTHETIDSNVTSYSTSTSNVQEPFVYMSTSPTKGGPRNSVRLEGLKRYNRGLFILDVRHMPAGCASWPAFWLTDEPNWPVNGEIDILEGVNGQTLVKTALHATMECSMDDVPLGVKTGSWDTAVGVPKKNGDLDMTVREANDCYVYNPHQWLNQGCVGMSDKEGTIGEPLNKKGGGVFALEWDPINKHISSFVFTPHTEVPENLKDTLRTASESDQLKRVEPDPRQWGLPYAYFPIGKATKCSADHFKNMHIIFNMALCGSVAGNRFFMDCPELNEKYGSCDDYVAADTPEMREMYWKVRGVYVYEREWERAWVN